MDKQNKIDVFTKGFLSFLKKEKNLDLLPEILKQLQQSISTNTVLVFTPVELDESKKEKTEKLIKKLTGLEDFEVVYEKDESLIDGMKLVYRDKMWDLSLSSQISNIVNSME